MNSRRHPWLGILLLLLVITSGVAVALYLAPRTQADTVAQETVRPAGSRVSDSTNPESGAPAVPGNTAAPGGSDPVDSADPNLKLVNKEIPVSSDYVPADLREVEIPFSFEEPAPRRMMRAEAADALERLVSAAEREDVAVVGVSGYRSYATQQAVFASHVEHYGSEEAANQVSAYPGESEHQTGLAMDVSSPEVGYQLTQSFGGTKPGRWLAENADRFGFVIRYPQGKEGITGYEYEPWHLRYVGTTHAATMARRELTLEEYLNA